MTLPDYIERNMESLLEEWERFARKAQPPHANLNREELRDWANGVLMAIAAEMRTERKEQEKEQESETAEKKCPQPPALTEAARVHAMHRLAQGFQIDQMLSEYRELRGTVVRRWTQEMETDGRTAKELVRFNEVLDRALTESIRGYSDMVDRARDLFIGAFGHDMRAPLGSILTTTEALLMSPEEMGGRHLQSTVRIRNSAKRINRMLQDLLDFTQTRLGGRLPMSRERTDLIDVCAAIVDEVRAIHPERDIRLECGSKLDGCFDAGRVAQMLSNLVLNAVTHGRETSPVRITAWQTDDDVYIRVHNEGTPIPPDLQRQIFEPLVRGQPRERASGSERNSGLGLGLFIACEIAQGHDGRISVDSTAAGGTTFEARLRRLPFEASSESREA